MNFKNEEISLSNACTVLIYDFSHIVWFQKVSQDMSNIENNKDIILFSQEDSSTAIIYKCFKKQYRNLQSYSKVVNKFREVENFVDEVEDNMHNHSLVINVSSTKLNIFLIFQNKFCSQFYREFYILKKCYYYSSKMGSIMHRAISNNHSFPIPIEASLLVNFKKDSYCILKNEIVEVVEMENKVCWKIKTKENKLLQFSPLFLKLNTNLGEKRIITKILERMDILIKAISKLYFIKKVPNYMNISNENEYYICKILEDICKFIGNYSKNLEILQENSNKRIKSNYHEKKLNPSKHIWCQHFLQFQLEIMNRNITNQEQILIS